MTRPFQVVNFERNTVAEVLGIWDEIDFSPNYQRLSDLWSDTKKQLFVDSLINEYDIPKLYFHDVSLLSKLSAKRFAIIDGKQRLNAIADFVANRIALSDEFTDVELEGDAAERAAGKSYQQLSASFPLLKTRFDSARLPIVLVQTEDREFIEEMFSRLNEALPLNAPEKRNALGGPLPRHIRDLARASFFTKHVSFQNGRYRHLDLATKFLYIESANGIVDLKKKKLDDFVKLYKKKDLKRKSGELHRRCTLILEQMNSVFAEKPDPLLNSVGMITVYYCLVRDAFDHSWLAKVKRRQFEEFEAARNDNKAIIKAVNEEILEGREPSAAMQARVSPVLAAFERFVQSPNDVTALSQRYKILRRFLETGSVPSSPSDYEA